MIILIIIKHGRVKEAPCPPSLLLFLLELATNCWKFDITESLENLNVTKDVFIPMPGADLHWYDEIFNYVVLKYRSQGQSMLENWIMTIVDAAMSTKHKNWPFCALKGPIWSLYFGCKWFLRVVESTRFIQLKIFSLQRSLAIKQPRRIVKEGFRFKV